MSIVLSARQAEDANRDLAKIARTGNSGLMLVPVEAKGAVTGGTKTPRIHLSKAGEFLTKPVLVLEEYQRTNIVPWIPPQT